MTKLDKTLIENWLRAISDKVQDNEIGAAIHEIRGILLRQEEQIVSKGKLGKRPLEDIVQNNIQKLKELQDKIADLEKDAKDAYQFGYDDGHSAGVEEGYKDGHQDGFDEGHQEGYEKGLYDGEPSDDPRLRSEEDNRKEVYDKGHQDGVKEGYDTGYSKGFDAGVEKASKLRRKS